MSLAGVQPTVQTGTQQSQILHSNLLFLRQRVCCALAAEEISIPEVREGWHLSWHPRGEAMLPEHVTVVSPSALPWEHEQGVQTEYLDQALIYNWLDQGNMFHQMMEAGNFIYATACRLLDACTHDTSHYQLFATVRGHPSRISDMDLMSYPVLAW